MGDVSITLNGRTYRLECGEGEEAHLIALAEYFSSHVETMKKKFGQVGDDRLILMAALMVTDEHWELKRQVQELKTTIVELRRDKSVAEDMAATAIGTASDRVESLNERLASGVGRHGTPARR
ncbi:MAG TPA: cell division protein ZapA [Methyloceanibacter sp.]|nr:cell division protein ZapA [Methyloceanibacter sp.]